MARTCRLTWAGGTRRCSLPFAHPNHCADGDFLRVTASLVARDRYTASVNRAVAAIPAAPPPPAVVAPVMPPWAAPPLQAETPPVVLDDFDGDDDADLVAEAPAVIVPPPPDPVTDPLGFLNSHHRKPNGVWRVDGIRLISNNDANGSYGTQALPFGIQQKLNTCCGVLNLGSWSGATDAASRAAFHLYIKLVKEGQIATMCIMSTTKYSQTGAISLLREAGFVETSGFNRNSGNLMSVWILRLYERG